MASLLGCNFRRATRGGLRTLSAPEAAVKRSFSPWSDRNPTWTGVQVSPQSLLHRQLSPFALLCFRKRRGATWTPGARAQYIPRKEGCHSTLTASVERGIPRWQRSHTACAARTRTVFLRDEVASPCQILAADAYFSCAITTRGSRSKGKL